MLTLPTNVVSRPLGSAEHLPAYDTVPDVYKGFNSEEPFSGGISRWFHRHDVEVKDGEVRMGTNWFTPKEGLQLSDIITVLSNTMRSWDCKHEHKTAGCGFMASEWLDLKPDS